MPTYTRDDVASALGISKATIPLWIMQGRLPAPTKPIAIGLPDYWPADVITPYLPGGEFAAAKRAAGRKPGRKPMTDAEFAADNDQRWKENRAELERQIVIANKATAELAARWAATVKKASA